MRLKKILKNVDIIEKINFKDYNIATITHNSKEVEKNSIFVCIDGGNYNGNDYALEAVRRGAKCLITEEDLKIDNVTIIKVENVRIAMSAIAKNFYNNCAEKLKLIAVIGTCGKTTTSMIIGNLLSNNVNNVGIIGTNGIFVGDIQISNKFTTPDPIELHYIFYQMKMLGIKTVIMEVSAQAIYLHKLYGIKFDIGVFTNISPEHLDFFGNMENYAKTKMNFFCSKHMKECVVNVDDFYGMEIAYKTDIPCISYSIKNPSNSFAVDIDVKLNELNFVANIMDDVIGVKSSLSGNFNVYNMLAGMTVAKMFGVKHLDLQKRVNNIKPIAGRLNNFKYKDFQIIVDFAHTPDSFENTLSFIRKFCSGRLITIFGCVGYSEREKRIDMGRVADEYSDIVILSTDNRGNVLFGDICKDIMDGMTKQKPILIEDRKQAIEYGVSICQKDDILCILGKGAEDFQKIGDERVKYSDIEVVENIIKGKKL